MCIFILQYDIKKKDDTLSISESESKFHKKKSNAGVEIVAVEEQRMYNIHNKI